MVQGAGIRVQGQNKELEFGLRLVGINSIHSGGMAGR